MELIGVNELQALLHVGEANVSAHAVRLAEHARRVGIFGT